LAIRRAMVKWCAVFLGATASVIPYGANSRTIAKELRGKVPGTLNKRTSMWVGTAGTMAGRFMTMAEAEQADKDGAAVGILAEHYPFIDIDVEDATLAAGVLVLAFEILGPGPIRRREGSPRCGVMYAGLNIRKRTLKWGGDKEQGIKDNGVEVLGRGQYWNADGLHPSGLPYYWDDPHPCDLGPFDLTVITMEMVEAFMAAVRALLEGRGFTVVASGAGKREGLSTGIRNSLDNPSLLAPSPEAVLDLLASYHPVELHHDEFVQHMVAIKAALGPDREDYYADVLEWAPGLRATEHEATRKRWDSIHDATIGWGWLCQKAGYVGADYDDPPPDMMPPDPGTTELQKVAARWVYDALNGCFHDRVNQLDVTKDTFNMMNTRLSPYGVPLRSSSAAVCINYKEFVKVEGRTYAPGKPVLFKDENKGNVLNMWRPSSLKPVAGDPTPWLDLVNKLFPDQAARDHFLNFIAYLLQNPGKKIGHAIMLFSREQGVGKGTVLIPLMMGLGPTNIATIEPDDLIGQFTWFLKSQLIVCNEMANFERKVVYNRLKAFLEMSSTPLFINEKFKHPYQVSNIQNWIFCTNSENAISLENSDRRFWIYEILAAAMTPEEITKIYTWYDAGGAAIVVHYLLQRDLSSFRPGDTPPMTKAKKEMIELAKPIPVRWLDQQEYQKREFITVNEIMDTAQFGSNSEVSVTIRHWHVISWLKAKGFIAHPSRVRIENGDNVTVWTRDMRPETMAASGEFLVARLMADRKKR
jgi:hypothetical protein